MNTLPRIQSLCLAGLLFSSGTRHKVMLFIVLYKPYHPPVIHLSLRTESPPQCRRRHLPRFPLGQLLHCSLNVWFLCHSHAVFSCSFVSCPFSSASLPNVFLRRPLLYPVKVRKNGFILQILFQHLPYTNFSKHTCCGRQTFVLFQRL